MAIVYSAGFLNKTLIPSSARFVGIGSIVLAIAAFVTALRMRTAIVAGSLVAAGVLTLLPPVMAIAVEGVIVVPGPIFGVISYLPILGLGVAKAIRMKKTRSFATAITD
jgi:hypothetical protein